MINPSPVHILKKEPLDENHCFNKCFKKVVRRQWRVTLHFKPGTRTVICLRVCFYCGQFPTSTSSSCTGKCCSLFNSLIALKQLAVKADIKQRFTPLCGWDTDVLLLFLAKTRSAALLQSLAAHWGTHCEQVSLSFFVLKVARDEQLGCFSALANTSLEELKTLHPLSSGS